MKSLLFLLTFFTLVRNKTFILIPGLEAPCEHLKDNIVFLKNRFKTENVHCLLYATGKLEYYEKIETQFERICETFRNENYVGEIDLVGFSQGGLFALFIATKCEHTKTINNLITFGSPLLGISKVPDEVASIKFCKALVLLATKIKPDAGPAAFFKKKEKLFKNKFLKNLVCEGVEECTANCRLAQLNKIVFTALREDGMIKPLSSCFMLQSYTEKENKIVPEFDERIKLDLERLYTSNRLYFLLESGEHGAIYTPLMLQNVLNKIYGKGKNLVRSHQSEKFNRNQIVCSHKDKEH